MKLKYMGHACFLLTNTAGEKLLMDPFDPPIGFPVPREKVDTVTTSHGHHDHNYVKELPEGFQVIDEAGLFTTGGYTITGIESFHDDERGAKRGKNVIFVVEADGLSIAHLGDLGHRPDEAAIKRLKNVDILLVPVGGFYTIDAKMAADVMRAIEPALTIPMHYQAGVNDLPIATEKDFVELSGGQYAQVQEIEVTKENLSEYPKILVLRHPE